MFPWFTWQNGCNSCEIFGYIEVSNCLYQEIGGCRNHNQNHQKDQEPGDQTTLLLPGIYFLGLSVEIHQANYRNQADQVE